MEKSESQKQNYEKENILNKMKILLILKEYFHFPHS